MRDAGESVPQLLKSRRRRPECRCRPSNKVAGPKEVGREHNHGWHNLRTVTPDPKQRLVPSRRHVFRNHRSGTKGRIEPMKVHTSMASQAAREKSFRTDDFSNRPASILVGWVMLVVLW